MKKLTSLVLCAAIAVLAVLPGCGKAPAGGTSGAGSAGGASSGNVKVGYACVDMNNTFQTYLVNAAKAKGKELGVDVVVTDAQNDVVKQQDQVKALIQQGVNALVVVPGDTSAMEPITLAAQQAGIPLVYCNVNPFADESEIPDNVHYIGSREIEGGKMQAEIITKNLKGGKVAILMGGLTYEASYARTDGNKEIFKATPGFEVIAEETAEWQRDKAIDVTNNWLSAFGKDLTVICANNDEMALGAIEALKAAGRTDVMVVGIDATPDGCASVKNGEMKGTIYQDSFGQGGGAVDIAVKMVNGEKPSAPATWIPYIPVDASNVDEFIGRN